jgi:hypothetical protein
MLVVVVLVLVVAVVVYNIVPNGLVIDLKKVDQIMMITVVNMVDIRVVKNLDQIMMRTVVKKVNMKVAKNLDHYVPKETNLGKDI